MSELEDAILNADVALKLAHVELLKAQTRKENAEAARIEKETAK